MHISFLSTGTNQIVDSTILKWNTKSRKFEQFQAITTIGAYDWTYFSVRGYQFLSIAQAFNGLTTLMESVIYVYQTDKFVPFQTLEVSRTTFCDLLLRHNLLFHHLRENCYAPKEITSQKSVCLIISFSV